MSWRAYNISITLQDIPTFFELASLPEPHVPADMLQKLEADDANDFGACRTIAAMDLVMNPVPAEQCAVSDFTVRLFDMAKTDVCLLMNGSEIILLVHEDKRIMEKAGDPEAQLIAGAIATFQSNNRKRALAGVPVHDACLIPGIVMIGTAPTFYKILVTNGLADAIAFGIFPPDSTVVHRCVPSVPRPMRCLSEKMKPLDNRAIAP
ncbi:hypothetical protein SERLA73DRAFT_77723 [Serpula lacrymans var. lacrymans S7.3]|uniref:Uncharacterized protein n=2 Tax=Serpula lacrymans var. lacrymans TaxID=341189 RepID=F8QAR7_SERL3|nr:uncharacterized protein SERLADRAFT_442623 [Serpula lacrymans var. lacrymans S7.9]EGN94303.1 hypothetical protein SERLA73DRAFT_77723 [Serpula lacrymans var. lacrymans S7.3]EGO19793.1 hypothetical protein SERLADRAFT_442623 [Serpula lacrymans var. lacrymans S7.9]